MTSIRIIEHTCIFLLSLSLSLSLSVCLSIIFLSFFSFFLSPTHFQRKSHTLIHTHTPHTLFVQIRRSPLSSRSRVAHGAQWWNGSESMGLLVPLISRAVSLNLFVLSFSFLFLYLSLSLSPLSLFLFFFFRVLSNSLTLHPHSHGVCNPYSNALASTGNCITVMGDGASVTDSDLVHGGNCTATTWPHNTAAYAHAVDSLLWARNRAVCLCQGYSFDSPHNLAVLDSVWDSSGSNDAEGSGVNSFQRLVADNVYALSLSLSPPLFFSSSSCLKAVAPLLSLIFAMSLCPRLANVTPRVRGLEDT